MLDLEQLFAAVERPQSEEAERLRMQLELNLIEYKALRELRRTLEEARQEMTIRLHDKLRRLRCSGRRLRSVLLEEHQERNPELILYEGASFAARKPARKPRSVRHSRVSAAGAVSPGSDRGEAALRKDCSLTTESWARGRSGASPGSCLFAMAISGPSRRSGVY
jgi:hypothetical protein